jgi:ribonucleotide monophosphatase NagD (HAD superfamily)
MRRAGLRVPEQAIVTAGFLLVEVLAAEYRGQPILLLAGPVLRRAAAARGLDLVDSQAAEVVAIARHETFGYRDLAAAANAIGSGAACIAANPDLSHPGTGGYRVPETGALVAAIQAAAGTPCPVRFVGKPEVLMAKRALERIGAGPEAKAAVLGDNPHTDGALAKAIGAAFVLVSGSL